MNFSVGAIFLTGTIASVSSIFAVTMDRFRNKWAGVFSLAGGAMPLLFLATWKQWIPPFTALSTVGLLASGPLCWVAFLLYGKDTKKAPQRSAEWLLLIGTFAGIGFSLSVIDLLSRME